MAQVHEIFNDVSRQPAHRLERSAGITGIAGCYIFPNNMTAAQFEDMYTWRYDRLPDIIARNGLRDGAIDKTLHAFVSETSDAYQSLLRAAWGQLLRLNPALRSLDVKTDDIVEVYEALFGAASGFCVDDIRFYLCARRKGYLAGQWAETLPGYANMENAAEAMLGKPVGWLASPKTMVAIVRQLEDKRGAAMFHTSCHSGESRNPQR